MTGTDPGEVLQLAIDRPAVPRWSGGAAFFDLDHVLIPGSSLFLLARDLRSHDVFFPGDLLRVATQRSKIKIAMESDRDKDRLQRNALSSIIGRSRSEVAGWCRQLAAYEILPRVYPDMARIIAAHGAAGDRTYLVTAAPIELAGPVAVELDIDQAIGAVAEVDGEGRYTGRRSMLPLTGQSRKAAILDLVEREGMDLRRCHVYASSADDKELLKSVGHPHAVNPEAKLLRTAVRRGWAVHEMRPLRRKILVSVPRLAPIGTVAAIGYAIGRLRSRNR